MVATIVRGGQPSATVSEGGVSDSVPSANKIAQIAGKDENTPVARTKAVATSTGSVSEWKVIGKSTEGRPLHTRRFGDSGPRTLIVAGLDGEDRIAVRWIDELADELARRPELYSSSEVLIFRAGNPDGLTHKVSENARSVLINRNFPSRRYRPLPDGSSGAGPATEAETRALLDTLYTCDAPCTRPLPVPAAALAKGAVPGGPSGVLSAFVARDQTGLIAFGAGPELWVSGDDGASFALVLDAPACEPPDIFAAHFGGDTLWLATDAGPRWIAADPLTATPSP